MNESGSRRYGCDELCLCEICSAYYNMNLWKNRYDREMTYRLPKLSWNHARPNARSAFCLFVLTSSLAAQDALPSVSNSGQQLVVRAATQMQQSPSLEAKIRQRVDLFGQRFMGTGHYVQFHHQSGNRFRLDLRLQVGDRSSSFQQHNDGVLSLPRKHLGWQMKLV